MWEIIGFSPLGHCPLPSIDKHSIEDLSFKIFNLSGGEKYQLEKHNALAVFPPIITKSVCVCLHSHMKGMKMHDLYHISPFGTTCLQKDEEKMSQI